LERHPVIHPGGGCSLGGAVRTVVGVLAKTARALVAPGKGILAMDESVPTITKRFTALGIESTFDSRRAYRQLLVTTPGLPDHISGAAVIAIGPGTPTVACLAANAHGLALARYAAWPSGPPATVPPPGAPSPAPVSRPPSNAGRC
jgi:hypothetical protein